jgi:hypothetical protein
MVTLNFTMHREIATMLEEAAFRQLKLLENKKLGISFLNNLFILFFLTIKIKRKYSGNINRFTKYIAIF